jgi:hypothetical protein
MDETRGNTVLHFSTSHIRVCLFDFWLLSPKSQTKAAFSKSQLSRIAKLEASLGLTGTVQIYMKDLLAAFTKQAEKNKKLPNLLIMSDLCNSIEHNCAASWIDRITQTGLIKCN